MGGSASRELEAAQAQVRRLTAELKAGASHLKATNASSTLAAAEAAKAKSEVAAAARAQQELQRELNAKSRELQAAQSQLRSAAAEAPRIKKDAAATKNELTAARQAAEAKDEEVSLLMRELMASKEELEKVFGKLKFAEQEANSVNKLRSDLSEERRAAAEEKRALAESNARLVAEASAALGGSATSAHPVFGELLYDFGYKRLYKGSPGTLWAGTVLWERQRAFRQERAALIATAKAKAQDTGWPGSISVVERGEGVHDAAEEAAAGDDGASPIGMLIDGQHRLGAAHLLSERKKLGGALASILVEVYPPMKEAAVKELFVEINRAEPVVLIDMPEVGASDNDNAMLTTAAEVLRERYPGMFKPSHGCRPPHMNVDVLRGELYQAQVLARQSITSADALVQWLEERNAELGGRDEASWGVDAPAGGVRVKSSAALQKALSKAHEHNFYLGLSWEWLKLEQPLKSK